jgi:hypothetical protein
MILPPPKLYDLPSPHCTIMNPKVKPIPRMHRQVVNKKMNHTLAKTTPMGAQQIPWKQLGQAALAVGKAIYKHPKVQAKWKKFKKDKKLEWLPFGQKPKPRRSVMGKINKHKYKKGTVMA